ncbi:quinol oxidase [Flavobacterium sp. xlx-214]|uniref:TQO small subunit DoxD n=1 Tax=unclassified Flavobacterium TaxID=196869 RepID=UPI0013D49572|nr:MULTISPECIES: TQO small subunit DoxD [unclassified Flavobacterium]MBA5793122.1 quinol oxidase [Flavobacterium sp. xlx-221]QMI82591.1 quinol oxidase [Flavobacterium sp. xlx-214]
MNQHTEKSNYKVFGLITFALRIVVGWTYFSAFWRRLILENKLIENEAGYIGEKFNHFLPNALGIKPLIEYLVSNLESLWWAMVIFTIVEGIVGLLLMLGVFTRLVSIGVVQLALGILLGSGWLGTTCLDEWQIGVLGVAGGFVLFLSGSGYFSLDHYFISKNKNFTSKKWFLWLGSGSLNLEHYRKYIMLIGLAIFGLTLFTNQFFHGGVYGKLHNKSVKPKLEITNARFNKEIEFDVMRIEGADVYGSFLIAIQLLENGKVVKTWNQEHLANFDTNKIDNYYVAKIKPGKHSLILPLGAKAKIHLNVDNVSISKESNLSINLIDISGASWQSKVE